MKEKVEAKAEEQRAEPEGPVELRGPAPPKLLVALRPRARRLAVVADLTLSGYEVWHAGDGFELLDFLPGRMLQVDLLVLGADLPNLSGLTVLQTLRRTGYRVPVLLVSDRPLKGQRQRMEPRYLMEPPFDVWHIVARIEQLVPPPEQPQWEDLLASDPPRSWSDLWLQLERHLRRDGLIHNG